VRSAKTLLGTNQLTPLSEACDQQIIANLLVTLHSPQTTTLRQIYMPRCTEIEENTEALAQRIETVHSELLKWVNTTTLTWLSPCVGNDNVSSVLKFYQMENYNRANIIQRHWNGYTSSNHSDHH
jgi:hypothetical protein